MAPIKFEENIKDKLEKRTLSPASDSWSKLSDRLDEDEKKSKKPIFWWLSIAAGLLIMVAISIQFFNTDESEKVMPQIVKEEVIEEKLNNKSLIPNHKESIELANEESRVEEMNEDNEKSLPTLKESKIIDYSKVTKTRSESKTQLAENNETPENPISKTINEVVNNELQTKIDATIIKDAVAEAMKTLKSENNSTTDQEIDSLLKIASKELFTESLINETTKTVDATQLLQSVEDDMGQSFRSKVFEALKGSYETVKTAVADRNN